MSDNAPPVLSDSYEAYMDTTPFWRATREGRLLVQYCIHTSRYQFYPRPTSVHSGRRSLQWREVNGRASLAAWTVDRLSAAAPGEALRIQALVDLEEGVRLLTWLVGAQLEALVPGQALVLQWVVAADGLPWPAFTPIRGGPVRPCLTLTASKGVL